MIKGLLKIVAGSLIVMAVVLGLSFMSLQAAGAQSAQESACKGSGGVWTPVGNPDGVCATPGDSRTLASSLKDVINLLIFVIGSIAILMIIIGAMRYTLAQGDSNSVNAAKNTIIYAIIGLVLAVGAYGIVNFVTTQFG